ncbi:MAG TPA: DUF4242 domain-containing protein [Ferruginibacter sp.]|nr:DUF4242 domain-containing protein [Ferruginibacter sp.]HMP21236.1 DUF4242 domain-containing protein [Ferruginibacter sp.]
MTTQKIIRYLLTMVLLFSGYSVFSQQAANHTTPVMKTYLIERDIPNAGVLTATDLQGISQKSCTVLKDMGPGIEWVHSYVTGNKIYCIYKAENEALIRAHAKKGGFPANVIVEVGTVISPDTAK